MTVMNELEHAGFAYVSMDDPWPGSSFISNYCLVFTKRCRQARGSRTHQRPTTPSMERREFALTVGHCSANCAMEQFGSTSVVENAESSRR